MKVKIKKLTQEAVIPKYSKPGDAGMDLVATSKHYDKYGNVCFGTGLSFEIPVGYVGLLFPRSSNSKNDTVLSNSVGVIDSGYRGEVSFKYKSTIWCGSYGFGITGNVGDRIGQLIIMPYPQIEFEEVQELSETERGSGGYGSTGK